MGRTLPLDASWDQFLTPGQRSLLSPLPLLLRRWGSDLPPGALLSLVPTFPRSPLRAVLRGGYVLPQSLPLDGGLLMKSSKNISASAALPAWPFCLVDIRRIYSINNGRKSVRSPPFADANLSRRFARPSCEWSGAGRIYHSLVDLKSKFGVSDSVIWRCPPKASLRTSSTWAIKLACEAANLGCTLTTVTKLVGGPQGQHLRALLQLPTRFDPRDSRNNHSAHPRCRQVSLRVPPSPAAVTRSPGSA